MESYWIKSVEEKDRKKFDKLEENVKTDICIIGGGLTGLSTAYHLSKYKIRTVLIEKDEICKQTSGNSTAKITSQHGLIYKYLTDSKGCIGAKFPFDSFSSINFFQPGGFFGGSSVHPNMRPA